MNENLNNKLTDLIAKAENEKERRSLIQITFKLAKEDFISPQCKKTLSEFITDKADSETLTSGQFEPPEQLYTYLAYQMYKEGICGEKNPKEAKKYLLKMVKHHKYYACKELLLAYRDGNAELDIAADKDAMIEWCFKIADYGSPTYLYFLALQAAGKNVPEFYDLGVEKDLKLAIRCLNKLNEDVNNFFSICDELDTMLNYTVHEIFREHSSDMYGRARDSFVDGLKRDFWDCTGYSHIRMASPHLINLLGVVYYELGDYENAAKTFERAVLYESLGGKLNLSDMYSNGIGVPQDKEKAFNMKKEIADLFVGNQLGDMWDLSYDEEPKLLETVEYIANAYRFGIGVQQSSENASKYYSILTDHFWTLHLPADFEDTIVQRASTALKEMSSS